MLGKLRKALQSMNLTEKESTILDILFRYDSLKVSAIAQHTHLNRTTAYVILKSLLRKGLVTSSFKNNVSEFQAVQPKMLLNYIEREKDLLERQKEEIKKILPQLNSIRANLDAVPKVTFYEGKEGVKQAYEDTLDNNIGKQIFVFSGPDIVFQEMGEAYVDYYVSKRKRLGIRSFQIAPNTPKGKTIQAMDKEVLRQTKLIPAEFSFDTEMVMYDDKVGIFSFTKDKLMAVIIEDQAIANTLLALYRYINMRVEDSA